MKSSKEIVEDYLKKKDWRVNENSNSPFSFGGLNKYLDAEVSKDYWLHNVYPKRICEAYVDGHMHIHDLGGLTLYCCGYSLQSVIMKGVRGVPNIPVSAPAKHFDSILNQLANLTTIFQNEIMGAVAFNSFDTLIAPFVKTDNLDYERVKQGMQNYIFSINSNSRAGAEPAFTNITLDLTVPKDLKDMPAIVGGEPQDFTYGDCQAEMDLVNKAFCDVMLHGDADGKLFAYPIPTYNITKTFDWDNANYDSLWEMAGKYGIPYFSNFINSAMDVSDVRSMCPLHGKERVLVRDDYSKEFHLSAIENLYDGKKKEKKYDIILNGEIKEARINRFEGLDFYKVQTVNGYSVVLSGNHLNLTLDGIKKTYELTEDDYLPFNMTPVKGEGLSYEDGLMVGAYLGDGSIGDEYTVTYSLNRGTKATIMADIIRIATQRYGAKINLYTFGDGENACVNVGVTSKMLIGLIKEYVSGKALDKELNVKCVGKSLEFREGIKDGYYRTDGGNKNRIYSVSKAAVESFGTMLTSMGIPSKIGVDLRNSDENKEPDKHGINSTNPVYDIRFYEKNSNQTKYKGVFIKQDGYMWFKIKDIVKADTKSKIGYCFEVLNDDEPYFTLPCGLVTHNCRLRLDLSELRRRNGGLFGSGDSTGSIGVVTINLPRIAYENKGDKERFYEELDKYLGLAKDSLVIKRNWLQENIIETKAVPAFCEYVGTLDNHFSTIGIVGMNEMCENFMGKNILDDEAHAFAVEVGHHILDKLVEFQEETGVLFNFEATPAESTCYRLARRDKETYPDIITQGNDGDVYYTNSCHIPVKYIDGIDSTFKHQNDLQTLFTGGTVIHNYLEGAITGEQAKSIVKAVFTYYQVPYMSISPISRYCTEHGYVDQITDTCPKCGKRLQKYQRITGYLRCVDNFNVGKKAEFRDRHQIGEM